jgi:small nuclear ribonucleoprotein (snRNP)-like protein
VCVDSCVLSRLSHIRTSRGTMNSTEDNMNMHLKDCKVTSKEGVSKSVKHVYLRG